MPRRDRLHEISRDTHGAHGNHLTSNGDFKDLLFFRSPALPVRKSPLSRWTTTAFSIRTYPYKIADRFSPRVSSTHPCRPSKSCTRSDSTHLGHLELFTEFSCCIFETSGPALKPDEKSFQEVVFLVRDRSFPRANSFERGSEQER